MNNLHKYARMLCKALSVSLLLALTGCNATKFVPQDKCLLNKVNVRVDDTKQVTGQELSSYLRQTPNSEVLGFWKLQLDIYNTAPSDTTKKINRWFANNARKMGEAPEIYDPDLTGVSMLQLRQAMHNKGYFKAQVDTSMTVKKRKVDLTYRVHAGQPYHVKRYTVSLSHPELRDIATRKTCLIEEGMQFDASILDEERQRLSRIMRSRGYYYFDRNLLQYKADSSYNTNEVSLEIQMQDYIADLPDSLQRQIYTKYYISRVCFHMDHDPIRLPDTVRVAVEDDRKVAGIEYSYRGHKMLRNSTLRNNCRIRPGELYNEFLVERTYALLTGLGPVKYVDISFLPAAGDSLECHITLSRGKMNSISAEVEGTYSAGDWGVAAGLSYVNRNIFRGAEELSASGRVSYEWRQNGGRALEAKAELGLQWPNSLKVNLAYNYQQRPDEYTRTIANAGLYYSVHRPRSRWRHQFNLVDISYVYLPWVSEQFKTDILERSSVLRYSYTDHFIVDWSYMGSYSSKRQSQPNRSYINFNYTVETAGNFLYGLSKVLQLPQEAGGPYEIFSVPFSQYAKGDVNFTYHEVITPAHHLVYHAGIGVAVPYLNAQSVPFEKRYFSGGSNSVRGWQARTLGPGGYPGSVLANGYDLQAGDIRLDLNIEYRWRVWSIVELAAFMDAGNIWTINDYSSQPYGVFLWDEFYKQIAWSYGVGVRLDFTVLVFRVDFGVKLHDPTRLYTDGKVWRTVPNGLGWKDDMTFHFAIGYPF